MQCRILSVTHKCMKQFHKKLKCITIVNVYIVLENTIIKMCKVADSIDLKKIMCTIEVRIQLRYHIDKIQFCPYYIENFFTIIWSIK